MKAIIEEYGKILMCTIIGLTVLGILITGIKSWYSTSYPGITQESGLDVAINILEPVIIVEPIEIELEEMYTEIDYTKFVTAYADSSLIEEIEVTVIGADEIDTVQKGIYQIIYEATNSNGYSFVKRVPVLIY
ncbi:MAG: hypothetical protein R3Y58_11870 [Eubacteriales bacterium]